jgi:hypothetical protein
MANQMTPSTLKPIIHAIQGTSDTIVRALVRLIQSRVDTTP